MTQSLQKVFMILKNQITDITDQQTNPLSTFFGQNIKLQITSPTRYRKVVDLKSWMSATPNLDMTQSLATFVAAELTDLVVDTYAVSNFPLVDPATGRYLTRMDVFSPSSRTGYQVSFGDHLDDNKFDQDAFVSSVPDIGIIPSDATQLPYLIPIVNGLVHYPSFSSTTLYALDGFITMNSSGKSDVTCLNTESLGGHSLIPLTGSMLTFLPETQTQEVYVTLPGTTDQISGKTPFLVIDGYLHALDDVYSVYNKNMLRIDLIKAEILQNFLHSPKLRLTETYFNTTKYEPYTGAVLPNTFTGDRGDTVLDCFSQSTTAPMSYFETQAFTISRLTSLHSFIILINTDKLYKKVYPMFSQNDPQRYEWIGQDMPRGAFYYGQGKILSYFIQSSKDGHHMVYLNQRDRNCDAFQTAITPTHVASPSFDLLKNESSYKAVMVDYYTGS